jgi:hypothetical protein
MTNLSCIIAGVLLTLASVGNAFIIPSVARATAATVNPATPATATISALRTTISTTLHMVPVFDKSTQLWSPGSEEDLPSAGYDVLGTLLRQGPNPTFQRLFKTDDYEQAVLKYMAAEKCSRNAAQGNMDAYLRNPNDWAYNRMKGYDIDYARINTKDLVLVGGWSVFVLAGIARGVYSLITHEYFWEFLKSK